MMKVCYSWPSSARLRAQKSEQAPDGAPDIEKCLSGAPPDCPVAHMSEAPTVGTQRPGDVAGAPDCPVRHTIEAFTNSHFGGWGYKYPNHHTSMHPSFQPSNLIQEL
jgi:hypothetical protein